MPKSLAESPFALALIPTGQPPFLLLNTSMMDPQSIAFPLLLTDCSAPGVRAGILGKNGWLAYTHRQGETGSTLFDAVKQLLEDAGLGLEDIQSFAYCEGPGSTLGIRINSMALRTWISLSGSPKPVFAYRSLEAARLLIAGQETPPASFSVLSDLRKHCWNGLRVHPDTPDPEIQIVSEDALGSWPSPRYFIRQRIHSPGIPNDVEVIDYDLEPLGSRPSFRQSFTRVDQPEVFQTTTTEFKKWTPNRHR